MKFDQAPGARNRDGARVPVPSAGTTRSAGTESAWLASAGARAWAVTGGRKRDGAGRPTGVGVPEVR